ncbi:MAG: ferredoxin [Chloroflexi bacterium]|nr:ferredoxin [Chloroflexota bacterium]
MASPVITDECTLCGVCEIECPVEAIFEGDDHFEIDPDLCVECEGYSDTNLCIATCPSDAIVLP